MQSMTSAARRWVRITWLAIALGALLPTAGRAATLYDSIQYGPSTVDAFGYLVGESSNVYNQPALKFTPLANGHVDGISFVAQATINAGPTPVDFVVRLWGDSGNAPGTLLEQINAPGIASGIYAEYSVSSASHPLLLAGGTYWLSLSTTVTNTGDPNTNSGIWRWSDSGFGHQISVAFDSAGNPPWSLDSRDFQAPLLRIVGTVPEPASGLMALLGLGLLSLAVKAKHRLGPQANAA